MRLLLTGATSNAGQSVVQELLGHGHAVTALVRQPTAIEGCRVIVASLADVGRSAKDIAACEAIVHLACSQDLDPDVVLQQDIAGLADLIDAWRAGPFVYVSATSVHSHPAGVLDHRSGIHLQDWFSIGKYANELQLRLAERRHGRGGATILRPAMIFASNGRRHDRDLLSQVFAHCRRGGRFFLDSEDGLEQYGGSFIGGADFAWVVVAALEHNPTGIFPIAGGFCTWRQLIETINRTAGTNGDFVVRSEAGPEDGECRLPQSRTELDTTAFANTTGFAAQETLESLVEGFVKLARAATP